MDTRRIRRLERRHSRRIVIATLAFGAIGVAIGLALPRSASASAVVLVAAAATLAVIALRADAVAPSHGLRYVVRLPFPAARAALPVRRMCDRRRSPTSVSPRGNRVL